VETSPAVPGRIVVDGLRRADWGLTWVKTPVGLHQVCFTDVPGFSTPACRIVSVTEGQTTTTIGEYLPLGLIKVDVAPAGTPVDVIIDGTPRNQFGAFMFMEPGSHLVCGAGTFGFSTPTCQTVTVTAGAQTNVTLTYVPIV
jgi:hypothetical protein